MDSQNKVYGYLRVSSDEQDVNNQKSGVEEFAESKSFTIEKWITDDGVSGTKSPEDRQLGVLMKLCKPGDIIICSELSRLGRKMLMVMSILEFCMKNNIMIYTVKDNYVLGDNIQSSVLAFAFSLASQIERDMIAMRTKEALAVRKKSGVLLGSPRSQNKIVKVTEDKVDEMIKLAEEGTSLSKIASIMDLHRITVGYYLAKSVKFKGLLSGFNVEFFNGETINLTKKNSVEHGFYYSHIRDAYNNGKDMSAIGIKSITPNYKMTSANYDRDAFTRSENSNIDREEIERYVLADMTIPEIHQKLNSLPYYEVYDYIAGDTYLSNEYRLRGHIRVKSKRK